MKLEGRGRRVCIYIDECDALHGKSLYLAVVQAARRHGLAGATVTRGIMGFGVHHVVHELRFLSLSRDVPVVVEIVDTDEKINAFLLVLDDMITEGMVTTSEVEILTYRSKP